MERALDFSNPTNLTNDMSIPDDGKIYIIPIGTTNESFVALNGNIIWMGNSYESSTVSMASYGAYTNAISMDFAHNTGFNNMDIPVRKGNTIKLGGSVRVTFFPYL